MPEVLNPSLPHYIRRRRFIKQSLTGGEVAAMSAGRPILASPATAEECGLPSKSEWLVIGLAFVTQVSNDAYEKIVTLNDKVRRRLDVWIPQPARRRLIGSALYWANRFSRISCSGTRSRKSGCRLGQTCLMPIRRFT